MLKICLLSLCLSTVVLELSAQESQQKVYMVSDAHFDSQWNWDVQKSIREYIPKTLDQNLMLLAKYPNYIFNFEGGIKYSWMKEYYPYQYELMKKYIKEGRWHVTGSTWDATDANVPSPESLTRNILYGQHYFRKEFGVESTDIFLPDCFGFGWTLPTVAAHSGLIGFSTQKLQWRLKPFYGNSKIPFEIGLWKGVDGSTIMLVADAHNYTSKFPDEDLSNNNDLNNLSKKVKGNTIYHYYGTGDTGGAPTIESVKGVEKGINGEGPVKIISATSDQLYKDYQPYSSHPELPVFNGELLMDVHGTGCYTSQAAMKLFNRRNELLATAAERAAVMADLFGSQEYPSYTISEAWKRFIWHQFHDDLTGTSIPRAYEFSWNDELISINQFSDVLQSSLGAVAKDMNTKVSGTPVVIFNPTAMNVNDVIEISIPGLSSKKRYIVYNEKGKAVPSQLTNIDGSAKLLVNATVPSLGTVVYDVREGSSKSGVKINIGDRMIENSIYTVRLDKNGDICSIVDKRYNKEMVKGGKSIRLALFTKNESFNWPAWEIIKSTIDREPISISQDVRITIAEKGSLRGALCVERKYGESTFRQYIRLNESEQKDRIDIVNDIDWNTSDALLKAEFPLSVANEKATYDLGVGSIKRGNNTDIAYEVYAQYWADLTDKSGNYGVSVMNDSKYGWDKPNDNTIRLTLLHTPSTKRGYKYQNMQDMGKHQFTYSIIGHANDLQEEIAAQKAQILNNSLVAYISPKHNGKLGRAFSLGETKDASVQLIAMKKAEDGKGYILRFYETAGKGQEDVKFSVNATIEAATEVNGVEDNKGSISFKGKELSFSIKPHSIKSIRVELAKNSNAAKAIESAAIALPYNTKYASYNSFRKTVNFDGSGYSYSAELLPENITYNGITFKMAAADTINAVKCQNQVIKLPEGNFNNVHLLVASTKSDRIAAFKAGNKEVELSIPYYSGFIGQWGRKEQSVSYIKDAQIAYVGTHRHNMIENCDNPYEFTYMFDVKIPVDKNTKEIQLPNDSKVIVFAASATLDESNMLVPASDIKKINLPIKEADNFQTKNNLLLGKTVIEKSGEMNKREVAEKAIDNDVQTKWCCEGSDEGNYIVIDLGKEENINEWLVTHAGMESLDYITSDFCLQTKSNISNEWKTADSVSNNKEFETFRKFPKTIKARYIKLLVTKAEQNNNGAVRINELAVY